ncbi:CinA family protein [Allohahella marinimesophila]|uniref:CinA family protein n=1 Tax=Allohahella marinimesophila TaxID=1054972 RepID=A0ABP7PPV9_9GAMM
MENDLSDAAQRLSIKLPELELLVSIGASLQKLQWQVTVAESCTAGGIGYALTSIAGSSAWFEQGFIVYSNAAKERMLEVPAQLLLDHGAVSEPVAGAMALGAARCAGAQIALAVSGIAGPGGGSADKPVGTVCFGWHLPGDTVTERRHFSGDRAAVREQTIAYSLAKLYGLLQNLEPGL